jgi:hypothetical protein
VPCLYAFGSKDHLNNVIKFSSYLIENIPPQDSRNSNLFLVFARTAVLFPGSMPIHYLVDEFTEPLHSNVLLLFRLFRLSDIMSHYNELFYGWKCNHYSCQERQVATVSS